VPICGVIGPSIAAANCGKFRGRHKEPRLRAKPNSCKSTDNEWEMSMWWLGHTNAQRGQREP
jgi:hypothetical protein